MNQITAEQISKELPLKVKSNAITGMFEKEEIIFFSVRDEPDKDWQLRGRTKSGKQCLVLDKNKIFERLEDRY